MVPLAQTPPELAAAPAGQACLAAGPPDLVLGCLLPRDTAVSGPSQGTNTPLCPTGPRPTFQKTGGMPQVVSKCLEYLSKPLVAEQGEALSQLRMATPNTQK